jgi:hypothetical protein
MDFASNSSEGRTAAKGDDLIPLDDRRALDRFVCIRPHVVRIMVRPALLSYQATIRNFTRVSFGISATQSFDPGTVLAIQLRVAKTGLSCVLSATVMRCQPEADGTWFLGCKLSRPLSDEETRSLF